MQVIPFSDVVAVSGTVLLQGGNLEVAPLTLEIIDDKSKITYASMYYFLSSLLFLEDIVLKIS